MRFKEWLQLKEVGTGTSCVAVVPHMIGGGAPIRRKRPELITAKITSKKSS